MKTSIGVGGYARGDITGSTSYVQAADRLGVDYVFSAEAWGQDAITSLAYLGCPAAPLAPLFSALQPF